MSPCIPHASPLLPRRASDVPVESQGSRNPHHSSPLQSTTDHHRPMTSFMLPQDHWAPVRTAYHSLFLLNRLRFSRSLHRSPSIQLHLQHDSMVDDQSTHAPHRLQAPCIHHLESTPCHSLVEATQALGACATCFHAQKSVTISITLLRRPADPTTVFCTNRLASIRQTA